MYMHLLTVLQFIEVHTRSTMVGELLQVLLQLQYVATTTTVRRVRFCTSSFEFLFLERKRTLKIINARINQVLE